MPENGLQTLPPSLYYRKKYRGLIGVSAKMPIRDTSVLSRLYTPGVGACCLAIAETTSSPSTSPAGATTLPW